MFRGVFVTGTDTGIGKTVVSAALLHGLRSRIGVRYWKPVQTGIEQDDDTRTVAWLAGCQPRELFAAGIRLPRPLSPHLAARLDGRVIALDDLVTLASAQPPGELWVVEGAGGVLVPLNDTQLMVDLAAALALPVVVVARTTLGTINHTLLTIEALRRRALAVAGVVMVGEPNEENRRAIERYGRVMVAGGLPLLSPLTPDALQRVAPAAVADIVEQLVEARPR